MKAFGMYFSILAVAGLIGLWAVNSDSYGKLRVSVSTIGQTPEEYLGKNNPNLSILPETKRNRKYSFAYTADDWFEKNQEYLRLHPDDAVILTSSGGSNPDCWTVVFTNRPQPDPKFFRQ